MKNILSHDYIHESEFQKYHRESRENQYNQIKSLRPKLVMDMTVDPRYDI